MIVSTTSCYAEAVNTVSNSALDIDDSGWGFTAANLADAQRAYVSVNAQPIMVTWGGTTPTTTLGTAVVADGTLEVLGNTNINNLKFIRQGGTDAEVTIHLEK